MLAGVQLEDARVELGGEGGDPGPLVGTRRHHAGNCESRQEVDDLWTALSEGGEEGPYGWLKDRYGLSWQIVPVRLTELLHDPDEAAAQRVMAAMLQMTKIDIAELERAYAAGA